MLPIPPLVAEVLEHVVEEDALLVLGLLHQRLHTQQSFVLDLVDVVHVVVAHEGGEQRLVEVKLDVVGPYWLVLVLREESNDAFFLFFIKKNGALTIYRLHIELGLPARRLTHLVPRLVVLVVHVALDAVLYPDHGDLLRPRVLGVVPRDCEGAEGQR